VGRKSLIGPGFYNLDVSLARMFRTTESSRVTVRASAFNILNHANLNNPNRLFYGTQNPAFGIALYGAEDKSGFPTAPLSNTPRQMQLSLKFEF
jgi:hypothetical protein